MNEDKLSEQALDMAKLAIREYDIIYLTIHGSHLYGLESPTSDFDLYGIFVPKKNDLLLENAKKHIAVSTGHKGKKNSPDDVDLKLISIGEWFRKLKKFEVNAMSILFSLYREDTILFCLRWFKELMIEATNLFLSMDISPYVSYCNNHMGRNGLKTYRYSQLLSLHTLAIATEGETVGDIVDTSLSKIAIYKDISPGVNEYDELCLNVLGKSYKYSMPLGEFITIINKRLSEYGTKVKESVDGINYKQMAHACRVLSEIHELITTRKITYPLKERTFVKMVKNGLASKMEIENYILKTTEEIYKKEKEFRYPTHIDKQEIDRLLLHILECYYGDEDCYDFF